MNHASPSHLGYGLGLRSQHWQMILETIPREVEWFEIISENFMHHEGYAREVLSKIRQDYPVVMHGVSLSIGSSDPLNFDYLDSLKSLAEWLEPAWISDHICWTGINQTNSHDLLPVPYTEDALRNMVDKLQQLQEYLGRQILLENPSNYMEFSANEMAEHEFVAELLKAADCKLLLDVNNIYVTCFNHRLNAKTYIDAIPADRIGQIHLAGHEHHGTHIIDTHDDHISEEVFALYDYVLQEKGFAPTMIEWDSKIPSFPVMLEELRKVKQRNASKNDLPLSNADTLPKLPYARARYSQLMHQFQDCVLKRSEPGEWVRDKDDFPSAAQMNVYQYAYRKRLFDAAREDYPETRAAIGDEAFDTILRSYIEHTPSRYTAMEPYIRGFVDFLTEELPDYASIAKREATISALREKPQPKAFTPQDFAQIPPEKLLSLSLSLSPATHLSENELLHCQGLNVSAYTLSELEYEVLNRLHHSENLEEALQSLYADEICSEETVFTDLQPVLMGFLPRGVFI
jgi:uncharacterized protein (UPF0276 family)